MLKEFKQLKEEFPDRILIASIMEEFDKAAVRGGQAWQCVEGWVLGLGWGGPSTACVQAFGQDLFAATKAMRPRKPCVKLQPAPYDVDALSLFPPPLPAQWEELIERCQETGVDAFEINFSCPHGMPERKMGMAMGQVGGGGSQRRWMPAACSLRSCVHGWAPGV